MPIIAGLCITIIVVSPVVGLVVAVVVALVVVVVVAVVSLPVPIGVTVVAPAAAVLVEIGLLAPAVVSAIASPSFLFVPAIGVVPDVPACLQFRFLSLSSSDSSSANNLSRSARVRFDPPGVFACLLFL